MAGARTANDYIGELFASTWVTSTGSESSPTLALLRGKHQLLSFIKAPEGDCRARLACHGPYVSRPFCLVAAEEGDLRGSGDVTVLRVDASYDFALAFILRVISPPEEGWTSQRCIFADLWHVVEVHGSVLSPFNKQLPNQFLGTGPQSITWTLGHCPVLPWVFHVIMATMYIHHVCHLGRRSVQQWTMIPNST